MRAVRSLRKQNSIPVFREFTPGQLINLNIETSGAALSSNRVQAYLSD